MMTLALIKQLSREAGQRAAKQKREPLVAFCDKDEAVFKCPNLGTYIPKDWKLIDRLFVNKNSADFLAQIKEGLGYAIIEEGEFQLYIGVFKKK